MQAATGHANRQDSYEFNWPGSFPAGDSPQFSVPQSPGWSLTGASNVIGLMESSFPDIHRMMKIPRSASCTSAADAAHSASHVSCPASPSSLLDYFAYTGIWPWHIWLHAGQMSSWLCCYSMFWSRSFLKLALLSVQFKLCHCRPDPVGANGAVFACVERCNLLCTYSTFLKHNSFGPFTMAFREQQGNDLT